MTDRAGMEFRAVSEERAREGESEKPRRGFERPAGPSSSAGGETAPRAYAERTIAAYRVHAEKAIREWGRRRKPSRFLKRFAAVLPRGGRVLDYGCGAGEEMAWLRKRGFRVEGVEGTLEFLLAARCRCPDARIRHARFETVPLLAGRYDGIWCNAALLHVPPRELARQLEKLKTALKPGGLLGLTLAWGRAKRFTRRDWIPGRYFAAYTRPEAAAFLRGWEVRLLTTASGDGRAGRWIQFLGSCHNEKHGGRAA